MNKWLIAAVFAVLLPLPLSRADDGAASIAAGGIVMKRESRITMTKEVLTISGSKVTVDYDFQNGTDADIRTGIAFPVAPYSFDPNGPLPKDAGFDDFKLWIDEKPAAFERQVRAFVGKQDITESLDSVHVDAASLGHFYWDSRRGPKFPDIDRLSKRSRERLLVQKLIDKQDETPLWEVKKQYYWTQIFPAHSTVHIRHEYTPVLGGTNSVRYGLAGDEPEATKELDTVCLDRGLRRTLSTLVKDEHTTVPLSYVDFILTTANTWKTPIQDFTLIVERPHLKDAQQTFVSFCWNGPVTRIDVDHFSAHMNNLVPTKELRVGFISVYKDK